MAVSPTLILSPERWKIRVFRSSEGSLERITKLERVSMAIILSTGTAKPGAVRELDSPAGREHLVFAWEKCPQAVPLRAHCRRGFYQGVGSSR